MFSRYIAVAIIGIATISVVQETEAGPLAGLSIYTNETEYDFVTDTEDRSEMLIVVSNEDDNVRMNWVIHDGYWLVFHEGPLNEWMRNSMGKKSMDVTYRGSEMKKPITVEMLKVQTPDQTIFGTKDFSHGRKVLEGNKVGVKICGEVYTFDLTHEDVAKARDSINQVVSQN